MAKEPKDEIKNKGKEDDSQKGAGLSPEPKKNVNEEVTLATLLKKINTLEAEKIETNKTLKMLEEISDKGRLLNYQNKSTEKKIIKAQLSLFGNGIIIGWRTTKDELIKHPTTGTVIGETQEYELQILDKEDKISTVLLNGYPTFSNARYNERIEVELIGKKEDFDGKITYDVRLPDGRTINLDPRFLN